MGPIPIEKGPNSYQKTPEWSSERQIIRNSAKFISGSRLRLIDQYEPWFPGNESHFKQLKVWNFYHGFELGQTYDVK